MGPSLKIMKHNHVTQMMTIEQSKPHTSTAPIPSNRKAAAQIKQEMENGAADLDNVGCSQAEARDNLKPRKLGNRKKCDTCLFRGVTANCVWVATDRVCTYCRDTFGRPFCSWTLDIPAAAQSGKPQPGNDFSALQAANDKDNILRRSALVGLPGWDTITASEAPVMYELDTGGGDDTEYPVSATEGATMAMEDEEEAWVGPSTTLGLRVP
jgi:hypothetical protein